MPEAGAAGDLRAETLRRSGVTRLSNFTPWKQAGEAPLGYNSQVTIGARTTWSVRGHLIGMEKVDTQRWLVTVDGNRLASFCSESRGRSAGTAEARRLGFVEKEEGPR